MSTKNPTIVLFEQPVRAAILLSEEWETRTVPAFNGTGIEFYDQCVAKIKNDSKQPTNRKEGELETTPTVDPVKEMEIKMQKYETVFQALLMQASELSALVRKLTTPVSKPRSRRNNNDGDDDDTCSCR